MAYSNSPQFNTYKTIPIKFDGTDLYRTGDLSVQRDLNIVNFYYSRVSQENKTRELFLKKRPGLSTTTYNLSKASASAVIRGCYYCDDDDSYYWAVGDKVYSIVPRNGVSVRTVTTLATSTGNVGFCSYLKSTGDRFVFFSDGIDLWGDLYSTLTCTKVTAPDFPTPHRPFPVYLDGYIFLIKEGSADLYNSNNDDPYAWTAGDFITAEINTGYAKIPVKVRNYLAVLGTHGIEYFYDGGVATGSPLIQNDSPCRSIGYIGGYKSIGDTSYFIGKDADQNTSVYAVDGFKVTPVSNEVVDRSLQSLTATPDAKGGVTLDSLGHCVAFDGHVFYVIVTTQATWAYDTEIKIWYEWRGSDGLSLKLEGAVNQTNGSCYPFIKNQTYLSVFSPSVYRDFSSNFACIYTTEKFSAETSNWKTCHRVFLDCDRHVSTGTSNVTVIWSDNDWASTTGTRTLNVFSESPFFKNAGRFRYRSIRLSYSDNYPLRLRGLELDLNVGSH